MLPFSGTARPSLIALADRARAAGQWDIAAQYYRKFLDRNPGNSAIWVQYGHALKESGHLAEAETAYRRALADAPELADSHLQLGHVLKLQGKIEEAKAAYLSALSMFERLSTEPLRELADLGWSESALSERSHRTFASPTEDRPDKFIDTLPEPLRTRVRDCHRELGDLERAGYVPPHAYAGRAVLDWEAGDCAWSVVFLLKGAGRVTAIDSWADGDVVSKALTSIPRFTFRRTSVEAFAKVHAEENMDHFDFVFANTVTEHIPDLPRAFDALKSMMQKNGLFFINHDNYYSPCGIHDHGFWSYGLDNYVTFQGTDCWASEEKCEKSVAHRRSVSEKIPWTWNSRMDARLTPENCTNCPYYKRSQPWAHLAYAHEFTTVYPEPWMLTGRDQSSLNKITPFQLLQFLTESGFRVSKSSRRFYKNSPSNTLLNLGVSLDDLTTGRFFVLSEAN